MNYGVDLCHEKLLDGIKPILSFDDGCNFDTWRCEVKKKLAELLGSMPEKADLNLKIEWEKEYDGFIERRMLFTAEKYVDVPCHLWIPKNAKKPCPVVICLQGHSTGMHISMGRKIYDCDEALISGGDRDFANQIVKEGYAALVLEQRAFGKRKSDVYMKVAPMATTSCWHPAMVAILMGKTLIGERVWDVSRAIDVLETIEEIDADKIGIMGNSGGGTTAFYAACVDERIKIVMPSCSICTYRDSIAAVKHCICNYIPNAANYFDMSDLACLIAPRPLVMVSGEKDTDFPIEGCIKAYENIEKIYIKAGAKGNCRLVVGNEGHRFYADISWPVFKELSNW